MDCFQCHQEFPTNGELLKHIHFAHSNLKSYACSENDYLRKFDNFNSYRKHRNSKHSISCNNLSNHINLPVVHDNHQSDDNIEDTAVENDAPPHNNSTNFRNSGECSQESDDDDDSEQFQYTFNGSSFKEELVTASRTSKTTFKDLVKSDAANFVAYCYSCNDITRKRTFELIDFFTKFQNGTAFHDLRKRVTDRLKTLGESLENIQEFENDFESLQHPFENFHTDHIIKKHFINEGTLILPNQVVIGERDEFKKTSDG